MMSREHGLTIEPKELVGMLTISKPSGGADNEYVDISITDELSGSQFVDLRISLDNFARALMGQGYIPCVFEHRPEVVGMKAEHKSELVSMPADAYADAAKETCRAAMRKFEVDGWKGRESDLFNHHCWVRGTMGHYQRVTFHRYVPAEPSEPSRAGPLPSSPEGQADQEKGKG